MHIFDIFHDALLGLMKQRATITSVPPLVLMTPLCLRCAGVWSVQRWRLCGGSGVLCRFLLQCSRQYCAAAATAAAASVFPPLSLSLYSLSLSHSLFVPLSIRVHLFVACKFFCCSKKKKKEKKEQLSQLGICPVHQTQHFCVCFEAFLRSSAPLHYFFRSAVLRHSFGFNNHSHAQTHFSQCDMIRWHFIVLVVEFVVGSNHCIYFFLSFHGRQTTTSAAGTQSCSKSSQCMWKYFHSFSHLTQIQLPKLQHALHLTLTYIQMIPFLKRKTFNPYFGDEDWRNQWGLHNISSLKKKKKKRNPLSLSID